MSGKSKGHTRNRPHRYVEGAVPGKKTGQWPSWEEVGHAEGDSGLKAAIGFVEFRDDGELHNPEQLRQVSAKVMDLAAATQANQGRPLLILLFIHGWHHNAAKGDENVKKFRELLQKTQRDENRHSEVKRQALLQKNQQDENKGSDIGTDRQVVGIYVGWRGESLGHAPEVVNFTTLWKRKKVAQRIGDKGLPRLMAELNAIRATHRKHRLVCIGHSLGGAMLFMGVQKKIMEGAAQVVVDARLAGANLAESRAASRIDFSYGDLTILLNPAIEASRFQSMRDEVIAASEHFDVGQPLAFASFTSKDDFATSGLFPASRFLGSLSWSRERRKRDRQAYGHHAPSLTTFAESDWSDENSLPVLDRETFNQAAASWRAFRAGKADEALMVGVKLTDAEGVIVTGGRKVRYIPFMNVRTNEVLIKDHNEIWSDLFSQFLRVLIGVHFARAPKE